MGMIANKLLAPIDSVLNVQVHSRVDGPIESLSFLRQSLLFSELSSLSYLSRADAGWLANQIGLPEIRFYDRDGAQAYIFGNDTDAIVTCRGTEMQDWNDLLADLDFSKVVADTVGWVHRGFKREVDDLWPRLEQALVNNRRTLWFAGHSLGAAMAAICAGRCALSHISSMPRAVFTYGSPRVGCKRYVNHVKIEGYRWVNNNDIVTRLPFAWQGFRHTGKEVYINSAGKVSQLMSWQRSLDVARGLVRGLRQKQFDFVADHSISRYVDHIWEAIEAQEGPAAYIRSMRREAPALFPPLRRAA